MKKKRKPAKKVPHIWCHYSKVWTPMGRARKKCPICSALLNRGDCGHQLKLMTVKADR